MLIVASRKKFKKYLKFVAVILIIVLIFIYFLNIIHPLVLDVAEARTRAVTLNAINTAATRIRAFEGFFGEFYRYDKNNDGEIVLVSANTANINQMYLFAQKELQSELNKLNQSTIGVPLGAFSGSSIFATLGPDINLNISLVGTSEAILNSYFYNEGINQTIHRIILRIHTKVNIIIPIKAANVSVFTDILIAEDIIIGRVPDSYITGIGKENIFDLLP